MQMLELLGYYSRNNVATIQMLELLGQCSRKNVANIKMLESVWWQHYFCCNFPTILASVCWQHSFCCIVPTIMWYNFITFWRLKKKRHEIPGCPIPLPPKILARFKIMWDQFSKKTRFRSIFQRKFCENSRSCGRLSWKHLNRCLGATSVTRVSFEW